MRPSALVDERLDLAGPAELTVPLGIIAFVGIDGADARHDAQGGKKQPLKPNFNTKIYIYVSFQSL